MKYFFLLKSESEYISDVRRVRSQGESPENSWWTGLKNDRCSRTREIRCASFRGRILRRLHLKSKRSTAAPITYSLCIRNKHNRGSSGEHHREEFTFKSKVLGWKATMQLALVCLRILCVTRERCWLKIFTPGVLLNHNPTGDLYMFGWIDA